MGWIRSPGRGVLCYPPTTKPPFLPGVVPWLSFGKILSQEAPPSISSQNGLLMGGPTSFADNPDWSPRLAHLTLPSPGFHPQTNQEFISDPDWLGWRRLLRLHVASPTLSDTALYKAVSTGSHWANPRGLNAVGLAPSFAGPGGSLSFPSESREIGSFPAQPLARLGWASLTSNTQHGGQTSFQTCLGLPKNSKDDPSLNDSLRVPQPKGMAVPSLPPSAGPRPACTAPPGLAREDGGRDVLTC